MTTTPKIKKKDKTIGTATKRTYDLPLSQTSGNHFLMVLIGLMSILSVLFLGMAFILDGMGTRWASDLQNEVTIEIPAEDSDNAFISPDALDDIAQDAYSLASQSPAVASAHLMSIEETKALLEPWLGGEISEDIIPIPRLITVILSPDHTAGQLKTLQENLKERHPAITLDTHQEWLGHVLRLTAALKIGAYSILCVILVTTIIAVCGAVTSKMAIHQKQIELLHLMGASDSYIQTQFQTFFFRLSAKAACAGALCGYFLLITMRLIAGSQAEGLLPNLSISLFQAFLMLLFPLLLTLLTVFSAGFTVRRHLLEMP